MGLTLLAKDSTGKTDDRYAIGNPRGIHHLRGIALALFTIAIWQDPTVQEHVPGDSQDEALSCLTNTLLEDFSPGDTEYTEEDVRKILASSNLDVDYSMVPSDGDSFLPALAHETLARQAGEGLLKLVRHSDCDGAHSVGDVADIVRTFEYLQPYFEYAGPYQDTIDGLADFFRTAASLDQVVVYA